MQAELDLLLEIMQQATATDALGRRRPYKAIAQAEARRKALDRRRDELRGSRVQAMQGLRKVLAEGIADELSAALSAGRAACLEGDAAADGLGPLGRAVC